MITCQFEDGVKTHLRHVVVDMLIIEDSKVFLVKRSSRFLEGNKYALVGGYLNPNENLEDCVKREALEETGYTVKVEKLFLITDNAQRKNDKRNNLAFSFIVTPIKKVSEPDDENTEWKWFDLTCLPPVSEIAFDHAQMIDLYKDYLKKPFSLPRIVSR